MEHAVAMDLIREGVTRGERWADLGAGEGTFTRALCQLLGPEGSVWAVDRSVSALRTLRGSLRSGGATVHVLRADFTEPLDLPSLDGVLMANALHFVADQETLLRRLVTMLPPGGRFVLVEYDRDRPNRWVPHPLPPQRFCALCEGAGLTSPLEIARRPSGYQGEIYVSVSYRLPAPGAG